jgi:hypothetical protein
MVLANQRPRLGLSSPLPLMFLPQASLVLPILFTRASTMIGGRMRIITGLILSPQPFGCLVTNMEKEEIAIGSSIGVTESTGITLY